MRPLRHIVLSTLVLFSGMRAAQAETQTTLNMTVPALTIGNSGSFSSSQASGPSGTNSGTVTHNYAGVMGFTQTAGTGRFATFNGVTRYGIGYDGFQLFQSFISPNYLTAVSSNTACLGGNTTWTWMMVRLRTPDAPRDPMSMTDTAITVGGTATFNGAQSRLTGSNYFNLAGPTLASANSYGMTSHNGVGCASGKNLADRSGTSSFDPFYYAYYGARSITWVSSHGNPQVLIAVPQLNLTAGVMSGLNPYVFTGLYTYFTSGTTQTTANVYMYPNAAGTTWTIKNADSVTNPTLTTTIGTVTCTTLNSPTTGFCSGTIALTGVSGTGKAVCMPSTDTTENLLTCIAQHPTSPTYPITIVAKTVSQGLLQVSLSPSVSSLANQTQTSTITATVTNWSSRVATSMGNPTAPAQQLQAPFSNVNAFGGGAGTCGTSLAAYQSCTFPILYDPTADGTNPQVVRVQYNNGVTTPNATANLVGTTGLASIAITPGTNYEGNGSTQQLTATATYSGGSTQDVTNVVTWASTNASAVSIDSTGLASWAGLGSSNVSATLGSVTSNTVTFTVVTPPVLTATTDQVFPSNYLSQGSTYSIDFNNISGGSPGNDTSMSYACVYDQTIDGAVSASTNCTTIEGLSLDATTGAFSWTPTRASWGPYELKITGTYLGNVSTTRIMQFNIRPGYVLTNLRGNYEGQFAEVYKPHASANSYWEDLTSNNYDGTTSSTLNATWVGAGTAASPYALALNGSANIDFGANLMASQTRMMFTSWIKPSSAASLDKIILGNNTDGTGNGFNLRQSKTTTNKIEFSVGQEATYNSDIVAASPSLYYRLDESSGTLTDSGSLGRNLTVGGSGTSYSQTGAISGDSNTALSFNGSGYACNTQNYTVNGTYSVEAWVYPSATGSTLGIVGSRAPNDFSFNMAYQSGKFHGQIGTGTAWKTTTADTAANYNTLNVWYHVVYVVTATTWQIYVNGAAAGNGTYTSSTPVLINNTHNFCIGGSGSNLEKFNGRIDEVAVYGSAMSAATALAHYNRGRNYVTTIIGDAPRAYWRLGETSGTSLADTTATGYTMTLAGSGSTLNQSGAIGNDTNGAISFAGAAYACRTSAATSLTGTFSVEAWVYATDNTSYWSVVGSRSPSDSSFDFKYQAGKFHGDIGNGSAWLTTAADTSTSYAINTWYHVVYVVTPTGYTIYVNGVQDGTGSWSSATPVLFDNTHNLCIGGSASGSEMFKGKIDEVAIYPTALTSAQVVNHYNAAQSGGVASCISTSSFSDSTWYHVSGLFDGTNAKLYVNGRQECTMLAAGVLTAPATNLVAGSTAGSAKYWTGSIAELQMYGTTGSSVGTASDIYTNWASTADQFRSQPVNGIVTSNLGLLYDAANATRGVTFPGIGITQTSWFDLSSSLINGALTGFTGSAGSRWDGTGATATPYRLDFNGSSNYVTTSYVQSAVTAYSVEVWMKSSDTSAQKVMVHNRGTGTGQSLTLGIGTTGGGHGGAGKVGWELDSNSIDIGVSSTTSVADGNWHHVVGTWAATSGTAIAASQFLIYIDGAQAATTSGTTGSATSPLTGDSGGTVIGYHNPWTTYFNGSLAKVAIYTKQLSLAEVKQNCRANVARFSGAVCN